MNKSGLGEDPGMERSGLGLWMCFNTDGTTLARSRANNLSNVAIIRLLFILSMYNTCMFDEQRDSAK